MDNLDAAGAKYAPAVRQLRTIRREAWVKTFSNDTSSPLSELTVLPGSLVHAVESLAQRWFFLTVP